MKIIINVAILVLIGNLHIQAQSVSRQMISSQGASITTSTGLKVTQTIGQQSATGNSKGDVIVQQGFQQSFWRTHLASSTNSNINVKTYPNPVTDFLNFEFLDFYNQKLTIAIFDINGRLVYNRNLKVEDSLFTLNLSKLEAGKYLIRLTGLNLSYYTKIIMK